MAKMNLRNKKKLASKVLGAGMNKIRFDSQRLGEIKEAITKQDIRDLHKDGFIEILPKTGRRGLQARNHVKGPGKIKKKVNKRKQNYVKITRKLRAYLKDLKNQDKINNQLYWAIRKKVKMRAFKSRAALKEYVESESKHSIGKDAEDKRITKMKKSTPTKAKAQGERKQ